MAYTINSQNDIITITINSENPVVKNFDINNFRSLRVKYGFDNCSDLFVHISENGIIPEIDKELYIELVRLINSRFPTHGIDWVNTFAVIEFDKYNRAIVKLNSGNENDEEENDMNIFDNIGEAISSDDEINQELNNTKIREAMISTAREKLIQRDITTV